MFSYCFPFTIIAKTVNFVFGDSGYLRFHINILEAFSLGVIQLLGIIGIQVLILTFVWQKHNFYSDVWFSLHFWGNSSEGAFCSVT